MTDLREAIFKLEKESNLEGKEMILLKYNPKEYIWLRMTEDSDSKR